MLKPEDRAGAPYRCHRWRLPARYQQSDPTKTWRVNASTRTIIMGGENKQPPVATPSIDMWPFVIGPRHRTLGIVLRQHGSKRIRVTNPFFVHKRSDRLGFRRSRNLVVRQAAVPCQGRRNRSNIQQTGYEFQGGRKTLLRQIPTSDINAIASDL